MERRAIRVASRDGGVSLLTIVMEKPLASLVGPVATKNSARAQDLQKHAPACLQADLAVPGRSGSTEDFACRYQGF